MQCLRNTQLRHLCSDSPTALGGTQVQVKVTEVSHVVGFEAFVALQAVLQTLNSAKQNEGVATQGQLKLDDISFNTQKHSRELRQRLYFIHVISSLTGTNHKVIATLSLKFNQALLKFTIPFSAKGQHLP